MGGLTHYVVTSNLKLSWDVTITNSVFRKNSSNRLSEEDLLCVYFQHFSWPKLFIDGTVTNPFADKQKVNENYCWLYLLK